MAPNASGSDDDATDDKRDPRRFDVSDLEDGGSIPSLVDSDSEGER